jgi:hypothetical protein
MRNNSTNPFEIDCDLLISRLSGPLHPADRAAFRAAAEDALARVPCWGEGAVYRAVVALQRTFFRPFDTRSDEDERRLRRSKLRDAEPIEFDPPDRRKLRRRG